MIDLMADIVLVMLVMAFLSNEAKWLLWAVKPNLLPENIKKEIEEMKRDAV